MSIEQVVNAVDIDIHKLPYMESLYRQVKMRRRRCNTQYNDWQMTYGFKYKISILDKIAFSSKQDCKTKQQEIRELTAQKDRIEKLIVNILNDEEGYSKLHQIAKESVKAVLSDNKNTSISSFCSNNPDFKNRSTNG